MGKTYTDGELDILSELNADADGWTDEATADGLDCESDVIAEIYAELDAACENRRLLHESELEHITMMLATTGAQAALWNSPPF